MENVNESSAKLAEFLLQIKAVKLQPEQPFTWASGWLSPIYCDNRKTLSKPEVRTFIRQQLSERLVEAYGKPEVIAGVATGGIAIGALVAQELGLPFVYVRSSAKGHGLQNRVEGILEEGQSVVVIEDLISTGKSSLEAVAALRDAGAVIKGLGAIFTYNFEQANENFKAANCPFFTISDYNELVEVAIDKGYIGQDAMNSLRDWRNDPSNWKK